MNKIYFSMALLFIMNTAYAVTSDSDDDGEPHWVVPELHHTAMINELTPLGIAEGVVVGPSGRLEYGLRDIIRDEDAMREAGVLPTGRWGRVISWVRRQIRRLQG